MQLSFHVKDRNGIKVGSGKKSSLEANARVRCVYFPVVQGKESIEVILEEKLEADGYGITENFESFSHVSIRRLGRLLPDARWSWLSFMEPKLRKSDRAEVLKRCCFRVKCFIGIMNKQLLCHFSKHHRAGFFLQRPMLVSTQHRQRLT